MTAAVPRPMRSTDDALPSEPALQLSPELRALVEAEVSRQVEKVRAELLRSLEPLRERVAENRASLIVFSGDLDRMLAAFTIATGAAASGLETSMFFTFWGLSVLKKQAPALRGKGLKERLVQAMTPEGTHALGLSKMNFFGVGARVFRAMMKEKQLTSLEELIALARELGVRFVACTMSMEAMGISRDELVDGLEYAGVATFLGSATTSRVSLFV